MILTLEPVHTPEFASKELGDTLWTAVREMVFDGDYLDFLRIETELQQAPFDAPAVTKKTAISSQ